MPQGQPSQCCRVTSGSCFVKYLSTKTPPCSQHGELNNDKKVCLKKQLPTQEQYHELLLVRLSLLSSSSEFHKHLHLENKLKPQIKPARSPGLLAKIGQPQPISPAHAFKVMPARLATKVATPKPKQIWWLNLAISWIAGCESLDKPSSTASPPAVLRDH